MSVRLGSDTFPTKGCPPLRSGLRPGVPAQGGSAAPSRVGVLAAGAVVASRQVFVGIGLLGSVPAAGFKLLHLQQ